VPPTLLVGEEALALGEDDDGVGVQGADTALTTGVSSKAAARRLRFGVVGSTPAALSALALDHARMAASRLAVNIPGGSRWLLNGTVYPCSRHF
jgi:hypothetical protein